MIASYDLDEATIRARTATALDQHPSKGRFVSVAVRNHDLMADVARTLERQIFGSGTDVPSAWARYERDSLFIVVLDRDTGLPVGTGRVVEGGGRTLDEAPELTGVPLSRIVAMHDMYDGKIWELTNVGVLEKYRGATFSSAVSSLLYRTFLNAGRRADVRHVVGFLDHRTYRSWTLLGSPLQPLGGSEPVAYLGSHCAYAMYAAFPAVQPSIAEQGERLRRIGSPFAGQIHARGLRRLLTRRSAARVAQQIASGEGLDEHVALPGLERRRLRGRR